jgi:kanosamine 6-kinase
LDLGASKLAVLVDDGREPVESCIQLLPTACGESAMQQLAASLHEVVASVVDEAGIAGAALACAPTLNEAGIVVRWPSAPHWQGVPLRTNLEALLRCPVVVEDDGNAAALAEAAALGSADVVYIGLGSGVGGGIISNGKVCRGHHKRGGELGHMLIWPEGAPCGCGRRGCLQAHASGRAMLKATFGDEEGCNMAALRREWLAGAAAAERALLDATTSLARAVVSLSEILDPEFVVLGGGAVAACPELIDLIEDTVRRLGRHGQPMPNIRAARHGFRSSLVGAQLLASARMEEVDLTNDASNQWR